MSSNQIKLNSKLNRYKVPKIMNKISPKMIYDYIDDRVVGQKAAKKMVSNAVFLHYVRFIQSYFQPEKQIKKSNLLLMGPSGNGKTLLVRIASEALSALVGYNVCPVLEVDCTTITGTGWVGHDMEELLERHYKDCGNEDLFHSSIIILDEIDKICGSAISSGGTDHNKITQYSLLKYVEGTDIHIKSKSKNKLSTHSMLFMFAGNFPQIRHEREKKNNYIGFTRSADELKNEESHTELEKAGMVTQLAGRISMVAELERLTKEELKEILVDFLIPDRMETFEFMGSSFRLKKQDIEEIVEECNKRNMGARGLEALLDQKLENRVFNCEFTLEDKVLEDGEFGDE